jgi:hypothetical protein
LKDGEIIVLNFTTLQEIKCISQYLFYTMSMIIFTTNVIIATPTGGGRISNISNLANVFNNGISIIVIAIFCFFNQKSMDGAVQRENIHYLHY